MRYSPIFLVCLLVLVFSRPAFGYIDPTSGSYFFQFLLALILGGLVAVKMFWRRIKSKAAQLFGKQHNSDDPDAE